MYGASSILDYVKRFYDAKDFPALLNQYNDWSKTKPLEGLKVLDVTPIFRNTLAKYAALKAAGAELFAMSLPSIPADKKILKILPEFGIKILENKNEYQSFDIILDCAGAAANFESTYGYSELTRTGLEVYKNSDKTVFLADEGVIKKIETLLGTGDGFLRALKKLSDIKLKSKKAIVFGAGKVGRGIIKALLQEGAEVFSVDDFSKVNLQIGAKAIDLKEICNFENEILNADIIVSAVGKCGALEGIITKKIAAQSKAIFVNMGVEDEFGNQVSHTRVLNSKKPINFILEEPTQLKYIDPTLALHNLGALLLKDKVLKSGINAALWDIEKPILQHIRKNGFIASELDGFLAELGVCLI